ncbi:MAG: DNA translocase FtsK [Treponema sp.]|nr:DNA translocase FtsK [Treponema sp.]
MNNLKNKINADRYFKYRTISVAFAVFFGLFSIIFIFALLPGLFGLKVFPAAPGLFFVRSFGILSMLIPVYFAYAAFILADPKWQPDRIFLLNSFIIPFLTLSAGFAFVRDFEIRSQQFALLNFTGKTGFSMIIISLTVIEVLALLLLRNVFFPKESGITSNYRRMALLPVPPVVSDNNQNEETEIEPVSEDNIQSEQPRRIMAPGVSFFSDINNLSESKPCEIVEYDPRPADESVIDTDESSIENEFSAEDDYIENNDTDNDEDADDDTDDDIVNDIDTNIDDNDDTGLKRLFDEAQVTKKTGESSRVKSNSTRNKKYKIPVDILNEYPDGEYWIIDQATRDAAIALKETLEEFKIQAEVTGIRKGPVITMFEILPAPGVKLSRIVGLQDNIALRLAASSVRIVAPIPGKHAVGIEVPNVKRNIVSFREIIEGELKRSSDKMGIPVVMGKDITGEAQTVDLVQMPHLLIAGATGSGKSVCVNSIILSILYQLHPAECRLLLIDPKIVELKLYNDIPHLLTPVITEPKKAFQALQYCIYEMERRYACLDRMGVRDIRSYNRRIKEKNLAQEHLPYIVVIIDEFADLMTTTGKELESTVARLAAMSRAVGIHLVLATQRPSIDVITGLIKANIPSRIAFMVASKTDSRIIIDMVGAEKLLGRGDMLYAGVVDPFPIRMQGAFISEEEVEAVVEHVKTFGAPDYIDDEIFFEDEDDDANMSLFTDGDDPLYEKALEIVLQQGKASASYIQRRLKIGFNRAARLVDEMEQRGVVGPSQGAKPRELLRGFSV